MIINIICIYRHRLRVKANFFAHIFFSGRRVGVYRGVLIGIFPVLDFWPPPSLNLCTPIPFSSSSARPHSLL